MKRHFDLLIADEVHEYKGQGTAQGIAAGLAQAGGKVLTFTGILAGGYSSALFHLIGNTVFLRLTDINSGRPPCAEQIQIQQLSQLRPRGQISPGKPPARRFTPN